MSTGPGLAKKGAWALPTRYLCWVISTAHTTSFRRLITFCTVTTATLRKISVKA